MRQRNWTNDELLEYLQTLPEDLARLWTLLQIWKWG